LGLSFTNEKAPETVKSGGASGGDLSCGLGPSEGCPDGLRQCQFFAHTMSPTRLGFSGRQYEALTRRDE
jgi:hypothetical protein